MAFLKNAGFALFIVLALAAGVWGYRELKKSKRPAVQAAARLPAGAAMYFETSNFPELHRDVSSRSLAVDQLRALSLINGACLAMRQLDSLVRLMPELGEQVSEGTMELAIYPDKSWILCMTLSSVADGEELAADLVKAVNPRRINGVNSLFLPALSDEVFFSVHEGALCVASDEKAIGRFAAGNAKLTESPSFAAFRQQHPVPALCNLFIDHDLLAGSPLRETLPAFLSGLKGISSAEVLAGTTELRFNGFSAHGARQAIYPSAELFGNLPGNCAVVRAWATDSFAVPRIGTEAERAFWKAAEDTALFDVHHAFYSNLSGAVASCKAYGDAILTVVTVRDSALAREHLRYLTDSAGNDIVRLRERLPLLKPSSGDSFSCAFLHNAAIFFTSDLESARAFRRAFEEMGALGDNKSFARYAAQNIVEEFTELFYADPRAAGPLFHNQLHESAENTTAAFSLIPHCSWSLLAGSPDRTRLHLLYRAEAREAGGPAGLWTFDAEHYISRQPELFTNHLNSENEVLLQDTAGYLYLLSAKGQLLWKRKIDGASLSPFYEVDAFRNNKKQILFNTRDAIYLIDRNGNDVEGFPVRLKSSATCGLSLFDYENTRSYRILLPCADRRIRNFGIDGREQSTWVTPKTEAPVTLPLQYANVAGSEFLVALDSGGRIYLLNRRGQLKQDLRNRAVANCSSFYADAGAGLSNSHIFYPDEKNALLNRISFSDQKQVISLDAPAGEAGYFFAPLDENRFTDLGVVAENKLRAYDLAGNMLFERHLPPETSVVQLHRTHSGAGLLAFSAATQEISFKSVNGTALVLKGTSSAIATPLFKDKKQYLLYADGTKVICRALPE